MPRGTENLKKWNTFKRIRSTISWKYNANCFFQNKYMIVENILILELEDKVEKMTYK